MRGVWHAPPMRRLREALSLRDSPIGRGASLPVAAAMAAAGLAATAIDMVMLVEWRGPNLVRALPALAAVGLFALLLRGDRDALGARLAPRPSVRYWLRAILVLAALFAAILGVAFGIQLARGIELPPPLPPPTAAHRWASLVEAPLGEETVYRWALVTGVAALGPRWPAVLVSGLAFGISHTFHDVHAANNIAAGFVFAWMYLRSGSIAVPIAFHALGNLSVEAINAAYRAYY